jgi:uncharacterized protein
MVTTEGMIAQEHANIVDALRERDVRPGAVPAFHIGGWYDIFLYWTIAQYQATADLAARNDTRPPQLLIGPWTHISFAGTTGELDFGTPRQDPRST